MKQYVRHLIAVGIAITAQTAMANPILYIDDSAGRLGRVDVQTGATTVIGTMAALMTDIAFAPNGDLYGLTFSGLYRIDPQTAAVNFIGNHGIPAGNALVFGTDGTLYAAGSQSTALFSINPATGASMALGNIGFASAGDLAFNNGQLYMSSLTDQLIRINQSTFSGVAVGNFGFSLVFGLATGDNNVLYGASGTQIFSVNTTTGAGTFLVDFVGQGLTAANGTSFRFEAVPEPATWALLGVAGVLAFLARRTKRRHTA